MPKVAEKSSQTPVAVNYFHHFPSNFLRPYGLAEEQPQEDKVFRRIAPLNCEWLTRPKVGASEFSDTIQSNLQLLTETNTEFIVKSKFEALQQNLSSFLNTLKKLNSRNSADAADADDVKNFLKVMLADNDDLDNVFAQMFQVGGAMYLLGAHYTVVKTLLCNPEWTAEKTVGTSSEVKAFKSNPSIKGLKKYLTAVCTSTLPSSQTRERRKSVKRNLTTLLDSDSEEESNVAEPPPKTAKGKKKKKKGKQREES